MNKSNSAHQQKDDYSFSYRNNFKMIPLQPNVPIRQLSFKNVRLELRKDSESNRYLELVHYSVLHRGRVLLSGIEGEVSSGEVNRSINN